MKTALQFTVLRRASSIVILLTLLFHPPAPGGAGREPRAAAGGLAHAFLQPPDTVKPWVYWYWISDNISREGITKDLEAMARVGVGEAFIGNIGLDDIPFGSVPALSEEWWKLVEHAIREGKRTGVNIGLFNSPGWSQSGGPWVKSTEAMRHLVSSETNVQGGRSVVLRIPEPCAMFQDVKVLAFPVPEADGNTIAQLHPRVTTVPPLAGAGLMVDGDTSTVCLFSDAGGSDSVTVDMETVDPFTARSLLLYPARRPFAADVELQAMDGGAYRSVRTFLFDRSNPSVSVGPTPYAAVAVSLPEITSRKFRLIMSHFMERSGRKASDAGIAEIALSAAPRLERYVEKLLEKMHQTPHPLWNEYKWPPQAETGTPAMTIDPANVIDISTHLGTDDTLRWDAPRGRWIVMRIGMTPTGAQNSPSSPQARGWEVDKMSRDHLKKHFDAYVGEILRRMPAGERTALKHVVLDSYEQGSENWTDGFAGDFRARYRYDPVPWLPVLSGRIVRSADQSDRFLWDMRRMIADRIAVDYVGGLRDLSRERGLRSWLENYGHWGFPSEFLAYGGQSSDIAGEFWGEGELGNIELRAASSAAHIYGKRRVSAESYTSARMPFVRYPGLLKKRGDWSYTEGINHVVLHVYVHQPYEERAPGVNAWFGIEFNRKNTWFEQSKKWIDYQRRCMFMLQQGEPVSDVCYFIGEDAPAMTGVRDPELPRGYSFDYINADVILHRLSVKDGNLVLPDGVTYRIMVLPPLKTMRPQLLRRIAQLVSEGAAVLGSPPDRSPGMQDFPAADNDVRSLAAGLWGSVDGTSTTSAGYGKGIVLRGMDMQSALRRIGAPPDVSFPEGVPLAWIHRRLGDMEIYFLSNQGNAPLAVEPAFRVSGKRPEIWDPVSGSTRGLPVYSEHEGATTVPLKLDSSGSAFIVFRTGGVAARGSTNFPGLRTMLEVSTPWQVSFDTSRRGPGGTVTMTRLQDWTKSADERIRFYSGVAAYRNMFVLREIPRGERLVLDVGPVGVMADISVNGRKAGGVWTPPWQVDITGCVRKGENRLEIQVVNTWLNRLIGDGRLPEKERRTWLTFRTPGEEGPLQPSGLMGPVTLKSVRY